MIEQQQDAQALSAGTIVAVIYACSLPALVINFLPLLVSTITASFSLSEQQSGFIASSDMAGYTLGTIVAFLLIMHVDWRTLARFSLTVMLLANLACTEASGFWPLMTLRFFSGVGGGLVTAVLLSTIAQLRNPDAVYGAWFALLSLLTIVGSAAFPTILELGGLPAAFLALATMVAIALPCLSSMPRQPAHCVHTNSRTGAQAKALILIICSVLVLTMGIGSTWTFLGQIGTNAGFGIEAVSYAIAISAFGGVAGGLAASWLNIRIGRSAPVIMASIGLVTSVLVLMAETPKYALFVACCVSVYCLWTFILPYLLGALAEAEHSGQSLALGSTAQGAGFMLGPFLASILLSTASYNAVLAFSAVAVTLSLLLFLNSTGQAPTAQGSMPR